MRRGVRAWRGRAWEEAELPFSESPVLRHATALPVEGVTNDHTVAVQIFTVLHGTCVLEFSLMTGVGAKTTQQSLDDASFDSVAKRTRDADETGARDRATARREGDCPTVVVRSNLGASDRRRRTAGFL